MLGITPGALRLPLCYVQIPASGWFVGEGLDPPAGLCAAASVPGDTAPLAIAVGRGSLTPPRRPGGRPPYDFHGRCALAHGASETPPPTAAIFSQIFA